MRTLWMYHQTPVFVMAICIADLGIQHQIANEDINCRVYSCKRSPTDRHLYLYIMQNSKDMLKRMFTDPEELLSRVSGKQVTNNSLPCTSCPSSGTNFGHTTPLLRFQIARS